ncbi:D-ribose pyranase [Halomonas saccharevitans]|uniref:D-ribose pyranase n=1 Tax=Halomonas saccharevitans TaxID=416872 RepID=A0A1I7CR01_9GAMM|nr:D-ribose pyranase [Halomonas saccharevitans]SFU01891.1 D-ribose pyranase [Halomonas saccharevitans]
MKRQGLLNAPLARLIAELGHTDTFVIADAGLPIPPGVPRVDLALRPGLPGFLEVFDALADELCLEGVTLASELGEANPDLHDRLAARLDALDGRDKRPLERQRVSHEAFKRLLPAARFVVRTGECTPYANVVLRSGVPF